MTYALVKVKVESYDKWKSAFDERTDNRRSMGSKGATIFRDIDNPDEVIILLEYDNLDNARKLYESLKKYQREEGFKPEVQYLEEVEKTSA